MGHHSEHPHEQNSNNFVHLPRVPLTLDIIKNLTGQQNILTARQIQIQLDINRNSIQNLGYLLPFLVELNISNSNLDSLRDLGTCLQNLKILRVSNCRLENLDGATSLINLEELEARANFVDDVYNCALLHKLETLDLEDNEIVDVNNLSFLSVCNNLQKLTIRDNPITKDEQYRQIVWSKVPQLKILDDLILTKQNFKSFTIGKVNNVTENKQREEEKKIEVSTTKENADTARTENKKEVIKQDKEVEVEATKPKKVEVETGESSKITTAKERKLQRRTTLNDLLHKTELPSSFWLPPDEKSPLFNRRRNSMVDEILARLEYDTSGPGMTNPLPSTSSTRKSSSLTKQRSMPDYPAWFDPYLSNNNKKIEPVPEEEVQEKTLNGLSNPNISTNQKQVTLKKTKPLGEIPSSYIFSSKTCILHDTSHEPSVISEPIIPLKKFPQPVQKGDSLEFDDSD